MATEPEQRIVQLELVCRNLYETVDPTERSAAEQSLIIFSETPTCLSDCQQLLERESSSYAQVLAATTLTKLVRQGCLSSQQRLDIRNYVLQYLYNRPNLPPFVNQALIQLFACLTKSGWFDSFKDECLFRKVIEDVSKFLQDSASHCMIGVQLLSELTNEINQLTEAEANRSLTKHRRTASSFRDLQLFDIFQLSCNILKTTLHNFKAMNMQDERQHGLLSQLLKLAHNCLTFDFIGSANDESSDNMNTVQIPTSWRTIFLDATTLQLYFDLYHTLPHSLSSMALSCLVQIASVRRSLFSNTERSTFLNQLMCGVKQILDNPVGLSHADNYHEFCRLLARLKSNYQLSELIKVDNYADVIASIAKFTVTSLQLWQVAPNSVHYLLSLWQRMVASVPYVKSTEPHLLDTYTPEVTKAYITSRLESVTAVVRDGVDDPLDDVGQVSQQLEQLSSIGRCDYEKTCTLLIQLFDQAAQSYERLVSSRTGNTPGSPGSSQGGAPALMNGAVTTPAQMDLKIQEGRLTWLVCIIGAAIGGRVSFNTSDEHDVMDGEMICRVLQLMNLSDQQQPGPASTPSSSQGDTTNQPRPAATATNTTTGCEKLELAMISFFEQFRKIYVGDQVSKTSKVYKRLSETLGLTDESMVLSVFIRKIISNLKYWSGSELVISKTLQLLSDLSVGYSSVRKLIKLDAIQFMLNNHTSEHFPFLASDLSKNIKEMRCRTMFYTALGRLLMVDLGEDEDRFEQFMQPLTSQFDIVGNMLSQSHTPLFNDTQTKKALVGLARDVRGIAFAFNSKVSYNMLFEWAYPKYFTVLLSAMELWYLDPLVSTPLLKLMAELVQNRSQRLNFDVSSPNGILLFREMSKMIVAYGSRILSIGDVSTDQVYILKLKGISVCFSTLKAALCGGYVNFGAFRLYGDDALDKALDIFVKLLLSIPQRDLLDYPKLSQTYYFLLEALAQDHMTFLGSLESRVFMFILSTIQEGLQALDTMVCTGCCTALDHIVTYIFKQVNKRNKKGSGALDAVAQNVLNNVESNCDILQQMLSTVLNIIMFEDCRNQWSMSRPLLGLILLNTEHFTTLQQSIVNGQIGDKQNSMAHCFELLMDGIERSLLNRNRDRFTQNLSVFRRDVNDSLKGIITMNGSIPRVSSSVDMMT